MAARRDAGKTPGWASLLSPEDEAAVDRLDLRVLSNRRILSNRIDSPGIGFPQRNAAIAVFVGVQLADWFIITHIPAAAVKKRVGQRANKWPIRRTEFIGVLRGGAGGQHIVRRLGQVMGSTRLGGFISGGEFGDDSAVEASHLLFQRIVGQAAFFVDGSAAVTRIDDYDFFAWNLIQRGAKRPDGQEGIAGTAQRAVECSVISLAAMTGVKEQGHIVVCRIGEGAGLSRSLSV